MLADARLLARFVRRLRPYLAHAPDPGEGRALLERELARRDANLLATLEHGVFAHPGSPYLALMRAAGIEMDDVAGLVAAGGADRALGELHAAGVHLTLDEFKGRVPIVRPGLELAPGDRAFDNPLSRSHYEGRTGGSRAPARRVLVDLALLEHECAYHAMFLAAHGLRGRPVGIWHPRPPGAVGIKTALVLARLGMPVERWFAQGGSDGSGWRHAALARVAYARSRRLGAPVPRPEEAGPDAARAVGEWLAARAAAGDPAVLVTTASASVRACCAALEGGLDLTGSFFVVGGEPYTSARAAVVEEAGARAASHYAMAEAGLVGVACAAPEAPDDVHLASDKVATIACERATPAGPLGALFHTTLLPCSPKLMVNVESGDYATLADRACGCAAAPAGHTRHAHGIRSYEKLTSEGMSFLGSDLIALVEEVLPRRFGGRPTDYQLREQEEGALTRVSLVISPRVGEVDEREALDVALAFLGASGDGSGMMAAVWAQAETMRVLREEPAETPASKVLPLAAPAAGARA